MDRSTRKLVLIWLATTIAVAAAGLIAYRAITRVPTLAGRTPPEKILEDPEVLFRDPGILGTAVEMRVTQAIRACMEASGSTYRGPAVVEGLDDGYDPTVSGYGIAAGAEQGEIRLGTGGPDRFDREGYELILYGSTLDGAGHPGGCAAVGSAELAAALEDLESLPYSIEQLEADMWVHPATVTALADWSACMAAAGYQAGTPADLIMDLIERISTASAAEARALAEDERKIAAADFACRETTIDEAAEQVAAELAPVFVEQNREQLESLMPAEPEQAEGITVPTDLGSGDVQVTLLWSAGVDLDLEVSDPSGERIYFSDREAASGGRLDRDANFPCHTVVPDPVENIFWPEDGAPRGDYRATVVYRGQCDAGGEVRFELIVRVEGRVVERIQDTLSPGGSLSVDFGF